MCFRSTVLPHVWSCLFSNLKVPHVIPFTSIQQVKRKTHLKLQNSFSIETDHAYYFFTHLVQRKKAFELIERVFKFHVDLQSPQRKENRLVLTRAPPIELLRRLVSENLLSTDLNDEQYSVDEESVLSTQTEELGHRLKVTEFMITTASYKKNSNENDAINTPDSINSHSESIQLFNSEKLSRFFNPRNRSIMGSTTHIQRTKSVSSPINSIPENIFQSLSDLQTASLPRKLSSGKNYSPFSVLHEPNLSSEDLSFTKDTLCKCETGNRGEIIVDRDLSVGIDTAWEILFTIDAYGIQKTFMNETEKVAYRNFHSYISFEKF